MNPLYNAAIKLYAGAVRVASLSSVKARTMLKGQSETLQRLADFRRDYAPDGFDVWFHAASLGEFEQARPLIDRLKAENPDTKILVSFFSPSGYTVRCNYPGVAVVYLPFDSPSAVKSFLDLAKPRKAIFVKYEFWGNFLNELKRRGTDTYIISAIFRPGQLFFRKTGGSLFRSLLDKFDHLYVQDERSRLLLEGIGIKNVTVAGDTRFDRVTDVMKSQTAIPGFPGFGNSFRMTFIAGSSWEADEERYTPWLKENRDIAFIIAPHEFDDNRLAALQQQFQPGETMLLSEWSRRAAANGITPPMQKVRGIIVDSFGKLSSLYRYARIAYIGGGFGTGIHNINEAAVYGIPVIFGPNHSKFKEAADLIAAGGAFTVSSAETFCATATRLAGSPPQLAAAGEAAAGYISRSIGATDRIYRDIFT